MIVTSLSHSLMTNQKPSLPIDSRKSGTQDKYLALLPLDARQPARYVSKGRIQSWHNCILGDKSRFAGRALDVGDFGAKLTSEETV